MALKTLVLSTSVAQVITLLTTVLVTRLYSKADYGYALTIISYANILTILITLRLEVLIVNQKTNEGSLHLAVSTIKLVTLFSMFGILVSLGLNGLLGISLEVTLSVIVLSLLLSVNRIVTNYFNAVKDYSTISLSMILNALSSMIFKVSLVAYKLGVVWGGIIAGIINSIYLCRNVLTVKAFKRSKMGVDIKSNLKRIYSLMPADMLSAVSIQLPIILTGYYFGSEKVAILGLAVGISSMPLTMFGTAISRVFRKELVDAYNGSTRLARKVFVTYITKVFILFAPIFIVIYFVAPFVFSFVFGPEYRESGMVVLILLPLLFLQLFARIFTYTLIMTDSMRANLIIQILLFLSLPIVFHFNSNDFFQAITSYSILYSMIYALAILVSWRTINA